MVAKLAFSLGKGSRSRKDGFYLLHITGGTEPEILAGPYQKYDRFLKRVRQIANDRSAHREEYDGLFYIRVRSGRPSVGSFTSDELEEVAPRIPCPGGECGGVIEEDGHCSDCGKHYKDKDHGQG